MDAKDITLNIAVNLGRISRWAMEGKEKRIHQFLSETQQFVDLLEKADKKPRFQKTFDSFKLTFHQIKNNVELNEDWAEKTLTWANILTHRAKLA